MATEMKLPLQSFRHQQYRRLFASFSSACKDAGKMASSAIEQSEFQGTVMMVVSPLYRDHETARFAYTDNIVGRSGDFPELTKAVRAGDLATVSNLCDCFS
jgi:hypothetical protein